jgi:hypothetical protein
MIKARTTIRAGWLALAAIFAYASTLGGDTSIWAGWAFLVWTFPFSGIWWFYLYDSVREHASASNAQLIGLPLIIVFAYVFWFVLIPIVWRKSRRVNQSS